MHSQCIKVRVGLHEGPKFKKSSKLSDPFGREQHLDPRSLYWGLGSRYKKNWRCINMPSLSCQFLAKLTQENVFPSLRNESSNLSPILSPKVRSNNSALDLSCLDSWHYWNLNFSPPPSLLERSLRTWRKDPSKFSLWEVP